MNEKRHTFSFLLRVWLAGDGSQPQWRASLENIRTGERRGFTSLEALSEFLQQIEFEKTDQPEDIHER